MTLNTQFATLIAMIVMGILFGAAFDTYNRFINRHYRKKWIVFINDCLFLCGQALLIFYVLFQVNYGEIRFYLLLALLCGFSAYQALLKKRYKEILEKSIQIMIQAAMLIKQSFRNFIFQPIRTIILFVIRIIKTLLLIIFKIGKMVLTIAKTLLKALLSLVGILFRPLIWILKIFGLILPKSLTERIQFFGGKVKEKGRAILKYFLNIRSKWNNKK